LPSWDVHTALSKRVFGVSETVSKEINRLVDGEDIHDLGRRLPGEPRLLEKFLDPELAAERLSRLKRAEMRIQLMLSKSADAFYLHHALDLLAPRLIAVRATDLPLKEHAHNICEAVCNELDLAFGGDKFASFLKEFRARFDQIVGDKDLTSWVEEAYRRRLDFESSTSIESYLADHAKEILRKPGSKDFLHITISPATGYGELITIMSSIMSGWKSPEWTYSFFMNLVSRFSSRKSHLIDYALITPFTWNIISEEFIRVTKRRAAGLGRDALRACEDSRSREEACLMIVEHAKSYAGIYLKRYGADPPQSCLEEYANLFITGYGAVVSKLGDQENSDKYMRKMFRLFTGRLPDTP
jgi:hypothetical protein